MSASARERAIPAVPLFRAFPIPALHVCQPCVQVHTKGRKMPDEASPAGDWLMALYGSMLSSSRWQRNRGADFVFYDPHPGFTDGTVEAAYYKLLCDDFQHAMQIVVERGQRNICKVTAAACRTSDSLLSFSLMYY